MKNLPFDLIRAYYKKTTPSIMECGRINKRIWVYPYNNDIDFPSLMTPIEEATWYAIRGNGGIPLYPQYPVNNFFLDFANPFLKVAIECDGKEFHKDKQKDHARDTELIKLGWSIYRISGADCNRNIDVSSDDLQMEYMKEERQRLYTLLYTSTVEGLVRALSSYYAPNIIDVDDADLELYDETNNDIDFNEEEEIAFYRRLVIECLEKRKVKI